MKIYILLIAALLAYTAQAANKPERRIIIENGTFYYFSVDEGSQLATLHSGKADLPFNNTDKHLLPLGRRPSFPEQPLAFDIVNRQIKAINWIRHPQQHPLFSLKTLEIPGQTETPASGEEELVLKSFKQSDITTFEPWKTIIQRNKVLKYTFFDLVMLQDGRLATAICNNGELSLFLWDGKKWATAATMQVTFNGYFSLFTAAGKIMLLAADGSVYLYESKTSGGGKFTLIKNLNLALPQYTLVINKDKQAVYLLNNEKLNDGTGSLDEMIRNSGILLIR